DEERGLRVSHAYGIEAVPTVIAVSSGGEEESRFVGFERARWRELLGDGAVDWSTYPQWRVGCGSRTQEPEIADRLAAEASGSPLRARRIEVPESVDPFEFTFEQ